MTKIRERTPAMSGEASHLQAVDAAEDFLEEFETTVGLWASGVPS